MVLNNQTIEALQTIVKRKVRVEQEHKQFY